MRAFLLGVGWLCTACSMIKTSSSTTTPSGPTTTSEAPATTSGNYEGPDAFWVPSLDHYTRSDVETVLAAKGFRGTTNFTGDTDPKWANDAFVCEQTPSSGKIPPTGTITVKLCNTYRAPEQHPELVGMTVEAATKVATDAGFTGKIESATLSEFDASCKAGTVCRVDPYRWYLNQDHFLRLYVNKSVTISTPDQ